MPKIRETKEAYIVEPSFMESLTPALNSALEKIINAYQKNQIIDQQKKKDVEEAKLSRAKLELELEKMRDTDPEGATRLQNNPAIMDILDPLRIKRMEHEDESPFTKFRHRKEHEALKSGDLTPLKTFQVPETKVGKTKLPGYTVTEGIPANAFGKGTDAFGDPLSPSGRPAYEPTPQLVATRAKAASDAKKAEAQAALETAKTDAILKGSTKGVAAAQMKLLEIPFTQEGLMIFQGKLKEVEQKYESEVPGTESFISKKAADLAGDLLKEYPGGNAKDLQAFARSVYSGEPLDPEIRKRLGASLATKKLKLDERMTQAREADVILSRQRLEHEKNKTLFETTQFLVNNGIDSADAPMMADSILKTGKAPEGMTVPQDLLKKAQQDKFTDDHLDAQIRSPRFQALSALAQRTPEGPQRMAYIKDMQTEFCKVAGASTASCGFSADPGVWVGFLNVYKANLDVALKVISKTSAIGAGTVDLVGEGVSKSLLPPMAPPQVAPGTPMTQEEIGERAAMTPEMTPELEAISKRYLDFAKPLLANPGTPLALRNKLTEDAKALAEAIQKRDLATIGRIMGGVQQ